MRILFYVSNDPLPINNGVTVAIAGLAIALLKYSEVHVYNCKKDQWYLLDSSKKLIKQSNELSNFYFNLVICSPLLSIKEFLLKSKSKIKYKNILGFVSDNYTYVLWRNIVVSWIVGRITSSDIKSFFKIPLIYIAETIIVSKTDGLIVQSNVENKIYTKYFLNAPNIFVLPNSTQFTVEKEKLNDFKREGVGLVASFNDTYMKVIKWFIANVWASVVKSDPTIKLHVLGKNSDRVFSYVQEEYPFLSSTIIVEKYYEDIQYFYLQRSIIVSPIFKNFGIINKTIEAMECGCIVIGDKGAFNGLNDFEAQKHGLLVNSSDEFVKHILNADKTDLEEMRINAHSLIKESLSWDTNAKKVIEFIKENDER